MPPSAITGTWLSTARRDVRHGGDLRHADAGDDARGADGARADADLDAVDAGLHEIARGFGGGDVAADDLQVAPLAP